MKAKPDCIVCLFKQALNTARLVTDDVETHVSILSEVAARFDPAGMAGSPAALSQPVYEIISEVTGIADPYRSLKEGTNRLALDVLPGIRRTVNAAADPLDAALRAAVAGNVIDLGIGHRFDIEKDIAAMLERPFAVSATDRFRAELGPGRKLLYLGDNAGEIVFDTLLVEKILATDTAVTFVVKSGPVINDATMADAEMTGMTKLVPVIETGAADIGIAWDNVSPGFMQAVRNADIILGKGHGNFETCNEREENFYFLLMAKCAMVAEELGVRVGEMVFCDGQNCTTHHIRSQAREDR